MVDLRPQPDLVEDLGHLADALESLDLGSGSSVESLTGVRDRLARSIRSYLIPRAGGDEIPLTVVFAGPTGAGKSTLVNSLSGLDVSDTGPLRPTTTGPVVLAGEDHVGRYQDISGVDCAVISGNAPILSQIALVDTPDIDSTSTQNRAMAEILIDNADIVVFVTSALRYADLVPWKVLRRAVSRGAPVISVLNRITVGSSGAATDFRSRLRRENLDPEIVRVPEHHIAPDSHRVPSLAVRDLKRRLLSTAADMQSTRRDYFNRILGSTTGQIAELADALDGVMGDSDIIRRYVRARPSEAARRLRLAPLCEGLGPPDPPDGLLRGIWWRWRNRVGEDEWREVVPTLQWRLVTLVEEGLRRAMAESADVAGLRSPVVHDVRSATAEAASAWLKQLERLSPSSASSIRRLGALVLAQAATEARRTAAFDVLFDDGSAIVKAYRGLVSRLEVIYDQTGSLLSAGLGPRPTGEDGTERVREALAMVVARSHFADA